MKWLAAFLFLLLAAPSASAQLTYESFVTAITTSQSASQPLSPADVFFVIQGVTPKQIAGPGTIINGVFCQLTASCTIPISSALPLTSGNIFIGNSGNIAVGVKPTGAISISNAGVVTLNPGVVTNASLQSATITINGIICQLGSNCNTSAASGTFSPQPPPKPPMSGWIIYADSFTGKLTAMGSNGTKTVLAVFP